MNSIYLVSYFVVLVLLVFIVMSFSAKQKQYQKENEELQKKLQKYSKRIDNLMLILSNLHEFNIKTAGLLSEEEVAESILESAFKLFDADTGHIILLKPEMKKFEIAKQKNSSSETIPDKLLKIGEEISEKVIQTGKPIFVEDINTDPRFSKKDNVENLSGSIISVPMKIRNKILGALTIYPKGKSEFSEEKNIYLLTILADQSAVTFENISLYLALQRFYMEFVESLAKTIDVKDSYTFEHAERSKRYARQISRELGLPEALIQLIEYASLLHDIGKIGIDNSILEKPGKLTQEERKSIEKHPEIGSKIVEPIAILSSIAPIILYHQEWYNGQGYPEGLKNEEIPLGARIVAVLDAYDAMTYNRPYRKAMKKSEAIEELKRGSGTQFDPQIVDVFLKILERENAECSTNSDRKS